MTFDQFVLLAIITAILTVITSLCVHVFKWGGDNPKIKNICFVSHQTENMTIIQVRDRLAQHTLPENEFNPIRVKMSKVIGMRITKDGASRDIITMEANNGTIIYVLKKGSKLPGRMPKVGKKVQINNEDIHQEEIIDTQ